MKKLVLVYGTLQRKGGNHGILRDSKYICDSAIPDHTAYFSGRSGYGFPVAMREEGSLLSGEVFEVTDPEVMASLDRLEGYDEQLDRGMYLRRKTTTVCGLDVEYYLGGNLWDFNALIRVPNDGNTYYWM